MSTKSQSYTFNGSIDNVFTRFTNAILLDFNQKSTTFNTSYTQPVGTEFKYTEQSFGQSVAYTVTITAYDKPTKFAYQLVSDKQTINVTCNFAAVNNKTTVTYSIILENKSFFQHFNKPAIIKELHKKFETYIDYTTKILSIN